MDHAKNYKTTSMQRKIVAAILQPIRRGSLSQKRCKIGPKLLVMPPALLTPGQLPASTPRRGTYRLPHTSNVALLLDG